MSVITNMVYHKKNCLDSLSKDFLNKWNKLYETCPWSTPYQHSSFIMTWYKSYKDSYQPIILSKKDKANNITGLFFLALHKKNHNIVVAGHYQAEYQVWLSTKKEEIKFIIQSLNYLNKQFPQKSLSITYLPNYFNKEKINKIRNINKNIISHTCFQPIMFANKLLAEKSLNKKRNRNRVNRLKRVGKFEFKKITDLETFIFYFDQIIKIYNFCQDAKYGCSPFLDDINKRDFHIKLFKQNIFHTTVMAVDKKIISAHIGIIKGKNICSALHAYSPFHADSSPGKLHLKMLSILLEKEGFESVDLTPGDRPPSWKFRYADQQNKVYRLEVVNHNLIKNFFLRVDSKGRNFIKNNVEDIDKYAKKVIPHIQNTNSIPQQKNNKWYLFSSSQYCSKISNLQRNRIENISYLHRMIKKKKNIISDYLYRLERGSSIYTLKENNQIIFYLWLGKYNSYYCKNKFNQDKKIKDGMIIYDIYASQKNKLESLLSLSLNKIHKKLNMNLYIISNQLLTQSCFKNIQVVKNKFITSS